MTEYQEDLRDAIKRMYEVDSTYLDTEPVVEVFKGEVVWMGDVEVFAVHNHPKAVKAYAWSFQDDDGATKYLAVLGLPPVTSAQEAVRAAIASGNA